MRYLLLLISFLSCSLPALAARNILVFGDSLSAGYGISLEAAWPSLMQQRLKDSRADYSVINRSVSGETTAGGRSRLPEALARHRPAILILALGANDGLRGLPLEQMQDNLQAMVSQARRSGAQVILVGMRLPPNYGPYASRFETVFARVAQENRLPLVKFLLDGIADQPGLFQADGLHPTAAAQGRILDNVWPVLLPLLR
ncbi:arylesterase [Azovibrio restrictus]|uniref:arylesterase n=1 Tax=Azovibrio restrictus TaxID=146938 RepID=UPI0026F1C971|nr:arylesterase [Azovibrio restrictus]